MPRIARVEVCPDFVLYVEAADGTRGEVSLSEDLHGPAFGPLSDPALFRQVRLDEFGAPSWPNGADLAPDGLYREMGGRA